MVLLKMIIKPFVNILEVNMTEEIKFLDRLDYIKSELHFLLDEIVVLEDQMKNSEQLETEKAIPNDVEMFQNVLMAKTLFKKYQSLSNSTDLVESGGLAYGT